MAETFSHSKLGLYESCPEAYKAKYIDKIYPDIPLSVHLFLGSIVHDSLEWLYTRIKLGHKVELDDLIKHFAEAWEFQFKPNIRTTKGEIKDYFEKGVKFLINYYQSNFPFKDNTIEIEKHILFPLDENNEYLVQGYIDRLVLNDQGEYEVHDYKTNEYMKSQKDVDKDRQLAFYHMGLKEMFGPDVKVKLIWHFLAHNQKILSTRDEEQLKKLKQETLDLIKKIETTTDWPACKKPWCDWCSYKEKMKWQNQGNHTLKSFFK